MGGQWNPEPQDTLNMKIILVLASVLALSQGLKLKLEKDGNQCTGTMCPAGCCPEVNWYCCEDNMYCAATAKLVKMAAKKQGDGTMCPAGCCPEVNWYCCEDNMYCAATAADCPFVAAKAKLVKMAAKKQCDGTMCPAG